MEAFPRSDDPSVLLRKPPPLQGGLSTQRLTFFVTAQKGKQNVNAVGCSMRLPLLLWQHLRCLREARW